MGWGWRKTVSTSPQFLWLKNYGVRTRRDVRNGFVKASSTFGAVVDRTQQFHGHRVQSSFRVPDHLVCKFKFSMLWQNKIFYVNQKDFICYFWNFDKWSYSFWRFVPKTLSFGQNNVSGGLFNNLAIEFVRTQIWCLVPSVLILTRNVHVKKTKNFILILISRIQNDSWKSWEDGP